ncbi:type I polyketide synthase [Niveispirillum sp. KHB5.9]|uniref:type I polyketide synthase n=1 Tax=Niveispirillum sp. KHB5.9 TaxID=3400269 RepID=UPI003A8B9410
MSEQPDGIAIIGMAGRFPGAGSVDALWRNLLDGVEGISTLTEDQLRAAGVPEHVRRDPGFVPRQGLLDGHDRFDAGFFGYSALDAARLDPQQRVFLEVAWEALEQAGIDPVRAAGPIGLYAGCGVPTYLLHNLFRGAGAVSEDTAADFATIIGNDKDFLATRVAYKLDLTGPVITVQTACSTSLVAVHMACQALLAYECDVAMAGGSTITVPQGAGYLHQEGMILSPDGHCRAFAADAAGTLFGSGSAVVVLKRLADALADGDLIDAVILGTAVNNDGAAKAGYTAPGVRGQARVVALAQEVAGVDAGQIGYVEAHGTGTPLGDPIEVAALTDAFRRSTKATGYCRLGTIKSAVGHLDTAAGVAGLIKAALAVRDGVIPPTLHAGQPNPALGLERTPFILADRRQDWSDLGGQRLAGVSAFGIGGTNAHVIVGQPPSAGGGTDGDWQGPGLLLLSAKSPAALAGLAGRYAEFLAGTDAALADICGTAFHRRALLTWRLAVAGRSREELAAALAAVAPAVAGDADLQAERLGSARCCVFIFPGQGSQWPGMGRDLTAAEPVFRDTVAACARAMAPWIDWDLAATLRGEGPVAGLDRIDVVQPALFTMQVALAALWRARGVVPDAVIGHSMGEVAAAVVSGALGLEDGARIICRRSALLRTVAGQGAMLAVDRAPAAAEQALAALDIGHLVAVAVANGPGNCVLSGDRAALERLSAVLEADGASAAWVKVDVASHGPQMDPLEAPLREALAGIQPRAPAIPFFSTVTGAWVGDGEVDGDYWWRNLRGLVRFQAAVEALSAQGFGVFLEASPHPVLTAPVRATLAGVGRTGLALGTLRRDGDATLAFAEAMGRLFAAGQPVSLEPWLPRRWSCVRLPAYAWEHRRYWIDPPQRVASAACAPAAADIPADADFSATERRLAPLWQAVLGTVPAGAEANFFLSGGNSLMALALLKRVRAAFGDAPTVTQFLQAPTLAGLALLLDSRTGRAAPSLPPTLLAIQPEGARPPLFMATPIMGTAFPYFPLAAELGPDQPFYALMPPGMQDGGPALADLGRQAAVFADAIEQVCPQGPVHVAGWSFGAPVAFELARELDRRGRTPASVLLIDTPAQIKGQTPNPLEAARFLFVTVMGNMMPYLRAYMTLRGGAGAEGLWPMVRVYAGNARATVGYHPRPWRGAVTLLRTASAGTSADRREDWGWSDLALGGVQVVRIPGNHMTLLQHPYVKTVANAIIKIFSPQPAAPMPEDVP